MTRAEIEAKIAEQERWLAQRKAAVSLLRPCEQCGRGIRCWWSHCLDCLRAMLAEAKEQP